MSGLIIYLLGSETWQEDLNNFAYIYPMEYNGVLKYSDAKNAMYDACLNE